MLSCDWLGGPGWYCRQTQRVGPPIHTMTRGRALSHYGKLHTKQLPSEVKTIWYSRDDELPDLPTTGTLAIFDQTDPTQEDRIDLARRLVEITPLTDQERVAIQLHVLMDYTLVETGEFIDRSPERVRQIIAKGLRRFRRWQEQLTGISALEIDPSVMSWFWWSFDARQERKRKQ